MGASTLVFDFDGTLHDSMHIYREALRRGYEWLVERGEAPARELADAEIEANVGLTAKDAWARLCPGVPWEVTGAAAKRVGESMHAMMRCGDARLFDGVPQMLASLLSGGYTLVFLSNCSIEYMESARKAFGLDEWFSRFYAAEAFGWEPKEAIFEQVMADVHGPYIVIGDRDKDLAIAQAHGLEFIGCSYGYAAEGELDGCEHIAQTPAEIEACVHAIEACMDGAL